MGRIDQREVFGQEELAGRFGELVRHLRSVEVALVEALRPVF